MSRTPAWARRDDEPTLIEIPVDPFPTSVRR